MEGALDSTTAEYLVRVFVRDGGTALLRVSGACMHPRVAEGERVRLGSPATHPPLFGDVVLARVPEGLRLHRLVWPLLGLRTRRVRTKADRASCLDAAVPVSAILATVLDVERGAVARPTRDVGRALRSLASALVARLWLALGLRPD